MLWWIGVIIIYFIIAIPAASLLGKIIKNNS